MGNQKQDTSLKALAIWDELMATKLARILALKPSTHVIAASVAQLQAQKAIECVLNLSHTKQDMLVAHMVEGINLMEAAIRDEASKHEQTPWFLFARRRRQRELLHGMRGHIEGLKDALRITVNTTPYSGIKG